MKPCISCERPNAIPASAMPKMCLRCWNALPQVTRHLFTHGGLRVDRLAEIARTRVQSVRAIGGGRQR